jgi:hypothetical protein
MLNANTFRHTNTSEKKIILNIQYLQPSPSLSQTTCLVPKSLSHSTLYKLNIFLLFSNVQDCSLLGQAPNKHSDRSAHWTNPSTFCRVLAFDRRSSIWFTWQQHDVLKAACEALKPVDNLQSCAVGWTKHPANSLSLFCGGSTLFLPRHSHVEED